MRLPGGDWSKSARSKSTAQPKLTMWNTGPGMDAAELHRICNIASSIGKEKSLTGNFGMGAKVASLPSNQRGMRYRSCKNGRVHEVILCKRDGVYGRLRRYDRADRRVPRGHRRH